MATAIFHKGDLLAERYLIEKTLGRGGMSFVYLAKDLLLDNREVAIKFLKPELSEDETWFKRFRNEVKLCGQLFHPNIVRVYKSGALTEKLHFVTMEYVKGKTLADWFENWSEWKPSVEEIVRLLLQIAEALSHAHQMGVIHRDLKPENIFVDPFGSPKIGDFGFARSVGQSQRLTKQGEWVGTAVYASPEQITGAEADGRSDIYSLGILTFELATGRAPFEDPSLPKLMSMHLNTPLPEFGERADLFPEWFRWFVERCTEKNPKDRFQSAAEVVNFLSSKLKNMEEGDVVTQLLDLRYYLTPKRVLKAFSAKKEALFDSPPGSTQGKRMKLISQLSEVAGEHPVAAVSSLAVILVLLVVVLAIMAKLLSM